MPTERTPSTSAEQIRGPLTEDVAAGRARSVTKYHPIHGEPGCGTCSPMRFAYTEGWRDCAMEQHAQDAETIEALRAALAECERQFQAKQETVLAEMTRAEAAEERNGVLSTQVAAVEALTATLNLHLAVPKRWEDLLDDDVWQTICGDDDCLIWDLSRAVAYRLRAALADPEVPRD